MAEPVRDFMDTAPVTVSRDTSVEEVLRTPRGRELLGALTQ